MKHPARVFQNVELGGPNGDCWVWQGVMTNRGYGRACIGGKQKLVHRVAYQLAHPDEDLDGRVICHKCDNTACCNPLHLFSGTQSDNMRDCVAKGRDNRKAKLSAYDKNTIKELYASGEYTQVELAKLFNVSHVTISMVTQDKL